MKTEAKNTIKNAFRGYWARIFSLLTLVILIVVLSVVKHNSRAANFITVNITYPIRNFLAFLCSFTVWSVAEWMLISVTLFLFIYVCCLVISLVTNLKFFLKTLLRYLLRLFEIALSIVFFVVLLLNVPYYADSFSKKSGIISNDCSVDDLYNATLVISSKLIDVADTVNRDENGLFSEDLDELFDLSVSVYRNVEIQYPFLKSVEHRSKKVFFSKTLSTIRTTGVAFPLTGEANINIDQPSAYIPVTITHEIAHQRMISSEQEANFVAILACDLSSSDAYRYSGYLFAYGYLASALADEDYERYLEIRGTLPEGVLKDLYYHYEYWKQYENEISDFTDSLYDDFLKSQGQPLGTKSYGAVVDLLIAYYN